MEMKIATGCIKAILEKYSDPIIKKITGYAKTEWEQFKVDSDVVFKKYLENSYKKYSKVKTILYKTEPKYLYNFFEYPHLKKEHKKIIDTSNINNLLDISNFLIIQGTGGLGKSTFMKHLFLNELDKKDLIPLFIELKDLNDENDDYDIIDFIFNKLYTLGSDLNKDYMEYALKSGCFLFLLDGYDEILSDKKSSFFKKITDFCDRYSDNYYILSSRPYSEFIEFQRFTILSLSDFDKQQALSLINKLDFDTEIKLKFSKALKESLYDKHKSFASNPLLLNIMLLTYDNYAEIPEKLHLFYENAFETLYSKHDATKGGYKRELQSKLSIDSFKKIFSRFCFVTYFQGKIEFTYDELFSFLKKIQTNDLVFDLKSFVFDLVNSICVILKDGLNYRFTHRSFQEYFTAIFLKNLSNDSLTKMGIELIKKDTFRSANDNVFNMLYDMAQESMEQYILLPLLELIEEECQTNKYDFYLKKLEPICRFSYSESSSDVHLLRMVDTKDNLIEFIQTYSYKYIHQNPQYNNLTLLTYIKEKMNYEINTNIHISDHLENEKICELFKQTWIGNVINTMANLKNILNNKKKEAETNLDELILIN